MGGKHPFVHPQANGESWLILGGNGMVPLLGLIIGLLIGIVIPYNIPKEYSTIRVAILPRIGLYGMAHR